MKQGINMHEHCISEEEVEPLGKMEGNLEKTLLCVKICFVMAWSLMIGGECSQVSISDFVKHVKNEEWDKDGLKQQIICFIVQTDQVIINIFW